MHYSKLSSMIYDLNKTAMGEKPCDLLLKNCSLINVYSKEIINNIQISILGDRIAYVGYNASHTIGQNTLILDLKGMYVSPGFADSHIHMDQFIFPHELIKKSLMRGVTSFFSDPIDIVSVCGYNGFKNFVKLTNSLPARIFNTIPGGLPVDKKFSYCKTLNQKQESFSLKNNDIIGMGEVFSWTKIINHNHDIMKKISYVLNHNKIINGHTAGLADKKLNTYISSGIFSCHEPINFDELMTRLRLGMWIMIREGSIRQDLKEIMKKIVSHHINIDKLMYCSDGLNPSDLTKTGHIDHCIRESIDIGLDPIDAIKIASKNCFDYYNLNNDFGGISPGKIADIVVFKNLENIIPNKVFVGGKLIFNGKKILCDFSIPHMPNYMKNTIHMNKLSYHDFLVRTKFDTVIATTILLRTEILTQKCFVDLKCKNGNVSPSPDDDIWKIAAFDRTFNSKKYTIGFLKNFGADINAFASTWNFHENNMIIIGSNENDMAIAANTLIKMHGGMVVIKNHKPTASLPLQFGGIMSTEKFRTTLQKFNEINALLIDSGCKFKKPYLIPLFLPFIALPEIRILCNGIIDVKSRSFLKTIT